MRWEVLVCDVAEEECRKAAAWCRQPRGTKSAEKSVLHAAYNPIHLENCKHLNST